MFVGRRPTIKWDQPALGPEEKVFVEEENHQIHQEGIYCATWVGRNQISDLILCLTKRCAGWQDPGGANKMNNSVWAPSFALPLPNSLLRIVDVDSLVEDQDISIFFLNFQLDPKVQKLAAVDLGPLGFAVEKCGYRWMCWCGILMGFKPPPYNLVRMYLVVEEVI
jgi:hypothetical protein